MDDKQGQGGRGAGPNKLPATSAASHTSDGGVPNRAVQEQDEMQAATEQMQHKEKPHLNEGGRTNESGQTSNPAGAVHGLPQPSLKGTWR